MPNSSLNPQLPVKDLRWFRLPQKYNFKTLSMSRELKPRCGRKPLRWPLMIPISWSPSPGLCAFVESPLLEHRLNLVMPFQSIKCDRGSRMIPPRLSYKRLGFCLGISHFLPPWGFLLRRCNLRSWEDHWQGTETGHHPRACEKFRPSIQQFMRKSTLTTKLSSPVAFRWECNPD